MNKLMRKYTGSIIIGLILIVLILWWSNNRQLDEVVFADMPQFSAEERAAILGDNGERGQLEPSYLQYYEEQQKLGVSDTSGIHLVIAAAAYSDRSEDGGVSIMTGVGNRPGDMLALTEEDSWVEYEVDIPEAGFYQMAVSYYALEGKGSSILRGIQIDGQYPFFQAKRVKLHRMWQEADEPWLDVMGNKFNPRQQEVSGWQHAALSDHQARASEPFRFHLTKGRHTLKIMAVREPAVISELEIYSPILLPTYDQKLQVYEQQGYPTAEDYFMKVQAEETVVLKSDPTIRRVNDNDPATEPYDKDLLTLNAVGGSAWRDGGQWIEWEIDVPASGLYQIGARFAAKWLNGSVPVHRKVYINGEVPFRELNALRFMDRKEWQFQGFGDGEQDYLMYLNEGKNRIRMEVQVDALGKVFEMLQEVSANMSALSREIIMVIGTNPDPNMDWQLERNIRNLIPRLQLLAGDLNMAIEAIYDSGVKRGSSEVNFAAMARDQLLDMADNPHTIPSRMDSFASSQSSIGLWISGVSRQRLMLDYFVVKSPDREWPQHASSRLDRAKQSLYSFFTSFTKDFSQIGSTVEDGERSLDVWIARGRDWVQIIKQLADEDFTTRTGIQVNVNVIPAQAMNLLMLASSSGLAPDVALGVEADLPIDFAIRNALVNLNEFPDYDQVADRFRPGALIPYRYNGGDYALPENQNFYMLFYRKDIMEEIGITDIPDTWEEVMDIIPILQQNGMDFYYPHAPNAPQLAINEFAPFLFQNGGEFYREDGRMSDLDSPEAFAAMEMWTGLYTNYKIDKDANFYNRFRSGEMPIGVADYSTYVLLTTAAPELTGWWEMKPMPGVRQPDGKVNRSTGGLAQTAMMFKDSEMKEEAWAFMKWWTSAPVQEQFGSDLESIIGVEARWNTANIEALTNLPWPSSDIEAILEQWEWFKEREIVIGGYYTTRHIVNMWNEIVLNGRNTREAIETGVEAINKELDKKREEFGLD
ncbi:extracellular solute-binding protein [Paenibacillus chungangensis]|uniref:Extracellular solute-binding protein n=1 Tax=Paenibacillus chungangensis TaxID=696535 RepID=A0ABW3HWZ1_9BACL